MRLKEFVKGILPRLIEGVKETPGEREQHGRLAHPVLAVPTRNARARARKVIHELTGPGW